MSTKFKATCRRWEDKPYDQLTPEQNQAAVDARKHARWDSKLKANVAPVQCAFETEDRALFEQHVKDNHEIPKHGTSYRYTGSWQEQAVEVLWSAPALPVKLWRPPRLRNDAGDGVDWTPKPLEPGDQVTWSDRTGQVWCKGWVPKSVWVVPDEPREAEIAVLLQQMRNGTLGEHSVFWNRDNRRSA